MPHDVMFRNGATYANTSGEIQFETGVASIVERALRSPYRKYSGYGWGNKLFTEGKRLNISDNPTRKIREYCTDAIQYLIDSEMISNVKIYVAESDVSPYLYTIKVEYMDLVNGQDTVTLFNWRRS